MSIRDLPRSTKTENKQYFNDILFRSDKTREVVIRGPPKFASKEDEREYQKQHLAVAFRALARQGYDEGLSGHISLRDPVNPTDEHGHVLPGGAQQPFNVAAFAIHSEIHKARPDVNAACHAHSIHGRAFSCFGKPLEMIFQDALKFYEDHAVYPRYGGAALTAEEGARIAKALGSCRSVILQNHGLITCGSTPDEAAFLFISLDRCCHAQLMANAASGPGWEKLRIPNEVAEWVQRRRGNPNRMWLSFQPYFDQEVEADPSVLE
ncbi:uncharacterized protein LDX57_009213 [Aspergillus melleus]|uniref:uncharacterized protein n=1 Tax=Aspergillus melleus TaxID=138277 RepID=UPI001E8DFF93|nr:uncharacterized protein LDX57_009213 [Aspergillus melleus]KAH8431551.1 hypothetical protein LDX57_009213 [Aspergillus melleus]